MSEQGQFSANTRGIIAIIIAMAVFVGNDTFVKLTSAELPSTEIMTLRGVMASLMVMVMLIIRGEWRYLPLLANRIALIRAMLEGTIALLFITSLAFIPLPDMTAIGLTTPLVLTALSAFVLKEQVGWRRWGAVVVGFIGMLLVVRPGGSLAFGWPVIFAVIVPIIVALRDILTLKVPPSVPSMVLTLATTAMVAVFGLAAAPLQQWVWPSAQALIYLGCASFLLTIGNYFIILAFRGVEVSVVAPYRYVVIIWAMVIGFLVWGDRPDLLALAGIGLIIASGLYTMHRQRLRRAEAARTAVD